MMAISWPSSARSASPAVETARTSKPMQTRRSVTARRTLASSSTMRTLRAMWVASRSECGGCRWFRRGIEQPGEDGPQADRLSKDHVRIQGFELAFGLLARRDDDGDYHRVVAATDPADQFEAAAVGGRQVGEHEVGLAGQAGAGVGECAGAEDNVPFERQHAGERVDQGEVLLDDDERAA